MSPYEIIQMVNRNNHDAKETIEDVNELIRQIDNNPKKFTHELSDTLEDWSEKLNLCPLCGDKIVELNVSYQSSEYFGRPVQERIPTYGCNNSSCGYTKQ